MSQTDDYKNGMENAYDNVSHDEIMGGNQLWTFVVLSIIACLSFWCQSIVTEERLVPALNVVSDYYSIPDDVAGATLMASGASSPEFICTIVSLFITHSSLGLGTIVGSEIFNLLIICAGSVYACKTHTNINPRYGNKYLVLDKAMVFREVGFYGLSIGLLYVALSRSEGVVVDGDGDNGETVVEYIYISFWKACLVFAGYIFYVAVCTNMELCISCFQTVFRCLKFGDKSLNNNSVCVDSMTNSELSVHRSIDGVDTIGSVFYKSFDDHEISEMPFIYNITTEPVENWDTEGVLAHNTSNNDNTENHEQQNQVDVVSSVSGSEKIKHTIFCAVNQPLKLIKESTLLRSCEQPINLDDLHISNDGTDTIGCFLWQRSIFYTKAYFGSHAFHLRWFTFTPHRITSSPNRDHPKVHQIIYPFFDEIHVDEKRLMINIVHPVEGKKDFLLMASSKVILDAVLKACKVYMKTNRFLRLQGVKVFDENYESIGDSSMERRLRDKDADEHLTLIERPSNANISERILWVCMFPLRFVMHVTLPDVRHLDQHGDPTMSVGYAYFSIFMCLTWLIIASFTMVASLEKLAKMIGISDSVMGLTVSAAGTSLPAYIASRIAAEKGFGNQAVANVFGSNTFNITVALGFPWALYIACTGFEPYHELEKEGMEESILILAGSLLLFIGLMVCSNFVLLKWHANMFIGLYAVYILYAVIKDFIQND